MKDLIRDAIRTRRMLEFEYGEHKRIAEPHVFGLRGGIEQVQVYQVEGGSSAGGLPAWRRVDLSGMKDLRVLERQFAAPRLSSCGRHGRWDITYEIVEAGGNGLAPGSPAPAATGSSPAGDAPS